MQITYQPRTLEGDATVEKITNEVIAPVLCDFTAWALRSAADMGVKRLYFLARDGALMLKIAQRLSQRHNFGIELRYLYCSRVSLRNAALKLLGDEKFSYLLEGGFAVTPAVILGRLNLNAEQRKAVYTDIGFDGDENIELGKRPAAEFCDKLRVSEVYLRLVEETADRCEKNALAYLKQEGLLDGEKYALVDSGWTGSVQHTLRVLTGKKQTGFYFGMYSAPSSEDGEFYPYLFNERTSPLLVSEFCNTLFEALCGADHGMTIAYESDGEKTRPVLKAEKSLNSDSKLLKIQERYIYDYADEKFRFVEPREMKERQKFAFPLLKKLMFCPEADVAEKYGSLLFSDDPSELYSFPLAQKQENAKRLYFLPRLREKYFHKDTLAPPNYWGYAAAVLSGKGSFCRFNLRLWEILWLVKRRKAK